MLPINGQFLDWTLDDLGVQIYPTEQDRGRGWVTRPCRCPDCGHRWQAVAPVGSTGIECPKCHSAEFTYVWRG